MELRDMKLPKEKRKETNAPVAAQQSYPWGLQINLDRDALKKLGIDKLPDVGVECKIMGVGKVTRVTESASDKDKRRSVEIQITKLALSHEDEGEAFERGFNKRRSLRGESY